MKKRTLFLFLPAVMLSRIVLSASMPPNIVVIIGDDVGFGDLGCYGADPELIPTPHLDRMAAEGLRFTSGYCANSTCTPSRYALLTGQYAWRQPGTGIAPPNGPLTIDPDRTTLADVLKEAGYATAAIGKWHLGLGEYGVGPEWNGEIKPGPLEIGFDYAFLLPTTNDRVPSVYLENHRIAHLDPEDPIRVAMHPIPGSNPYSQVDPSTLTYRSTHGHNHSVWNGVGRIGYMSGGMQARFRDQDNADDFLGKALPWIEEQARAEKPFFLYFASQDIHVPRLPHERFQGKSGLGWRGDAIVQLDWTAGALLDKLRELGIEGNTLVIFCSDNGPVYDDGYADGTTVRTSTAEIDRGHDGSGIWRGGKYQVYEGGTRTPFIAWWPGRIAPGGISDEMICAIDLAASFATLAGQKVSDPDAFPDSVNLADVLLGVEGAKGREMLIQSDNTGERMGFRWGNWKLVNEQELYDLETDPGELTNLARLYPEQLDQMLMMRNRIVEAKRSVDLPPPTASEIGRMSSHPHAPGPSKGPKMEAEAAAVENGTLKSIGSGWSGEGFVDLNEGGQVAFLYVSTGGSFDLDLRTAGAADGMALEVSVNGAVVEAKLAIPATGSWNASWRTVSLQDVEMKKGLNTIRFRDVGRDNPQIDFLTVH